MSADRYGHMLNGESIAAPGSGWRILDAGEAVPRVRREFVQGHGWGWPRVTMDSNTPNTARLFGQVRAIAVPLLIA